MKIGILTLVPYDNYGGILQGYALQTQLERMGHEVWILHTKLYNYTPLRRKIRYLTKWYIGKLLHKKEIPAINIYSYQKYRVQNIVPFISKYIHLTREFSSKEDLYKFQEQEKFEAFIVGSDQTWRPCLSPDLYHMFLDFLPQESSKLRLAYAASFGVDYMEFTSKQLKICKPLLQRFNSVSVREKSGIELCRKYFAISAELVLDPTMLLDKQDYLRLINSYSPRHRKIDLMQYIFFFNQEKYNIIKKVSERTGFIPVNLMTKRFLHEVYKKEQLSDAVFMPVEEWIYGYSQAKFVLTDSFHGTVFCIIFNVPFLTISPNAATRLHSLLSTYHLEDRLISKADEITEDLLQKPINWEEVNQIRMNLKTQSIKYLTRYINNNYKTR